MRRVLVFVLVIAVLAQPISTVGAPAQSDSTIVRTTTLSLTPDQPGVVDVTVDYDVPSNLESLTTTIPAAATVRETTGFVEDDGNYTWESGAADPSITLAVQANRTGEGLRAEPTGTGYEFVDAGSWAIVTRPRMSTYWTYTGTQPSFESELRTSGPGVAGDRMVYLGPSSQYERSVEGQEVTLVVPEAASLDADPNEILDSVEAASTSMRVGERDPQVTFVAAPTTVEWAAGGLASDADAWVRADATLSTPNNVWLHEYAHTRMDFRPATDAQWLIEASAEYYAASMTLQQGRIEFEAFADHLSSGERDRYESSIMTQPGTWEPGAQYVKGSLILGTVDRRMRTATDSSRTTDDLLRAINERDDPVTHTFVRSTVATLVDRETADHLDTYATGTTPPDMWTRTQHSDAFSTLPPRFTVGADRTYEIRGPCRQETVDSLPVLVPGETLTVHATVTNAGEASGEYRIPLTIDGTEVDVASGTLTATETTSIELSTTIDSVGTRTLAIDGVRSELRVRELASPRVTTVRVIDETPTTDRPVRVTLTATNPTDRPAGGEIPVYVDGAVAATWTPTIGPGESVSTTLMVDIDRPGTHTIEAGEQSIEVSVTGDGEFTDVDIPGFSVKDGVLAIALVSLLFVLWRRSP